MLWSYGTAEAILKTTIVTPSWLSTNDGAPEARDVLALVIAWSFAEPQRTGEVALLAADDPPHVLGRGEEHDGSEPCLIFYRQRPGRLDQQPPLEDPRLSRRQLVIRPGEAGLEVECVGRRPMTVNGHPAKKKTIQPGDTVHLEKQLVLFCSQRSVPMAKLRHFPADRLPAFGQPDLVGMLGESPVAWRLRDDLAFAADQKAHVLVTGPSGAGKELAARAIHGLSARRKRPMVGRNAATFPEGLIDAELFGNILDYPNAGMPDRPGLIGEADGSTLFLDEIGELASDLQARLLRVLDSQGEYQRLGEERSRQADLRLVAATNRSPDALKHDLLARLTLRVGVPPLNDRREDIPLLIRHMMDDMVASNPKVARQFVEERDDGERFVRLDPRLVDLLLRHQYTLHAREVARLLLLAVGGSERSFIELTDDVQQNVVLAGGGFTDPTGLSPQEIQEALNRNGGNQAATFRELGLKNRDVLARLIKKHGIEIRRKKS